MARTPSLTPQEAEQAIGFARGKLVYVGAGIASDVRKWLTAMGLSGLYVGALERKVWVEIYNDTTNATLESHKAKDKGATSQEASESSYVPVADEDSEPTATFLPTPTVPSTSSAAGNLAKAIQDALNGACNPEMVNAIIDQRLADLPELVAKHANVLKIELTRQDGTTHNVEGHAHAKLPILLKAMASRQANGFAPNIMLCGETGSGKTHAFKQACDALGLESRTNGAISMDHQLIGFVDAGGRYHETPLRYAFDKPCGYLFDEMDSSDNSPLLCLAGLLANGSFAFPDGIAQRHRDCIIVAAGNTWGDGPSADFVGRNKLDAAIRSRFPVRIHWNIDEALERNMCGNVDWACRVQKARAKARALGLKVIIDSRMSQAGAALIASGMSFDEAAEYTYLATLNSDQRRMIQAD